MVAIDVDEARVCPGSCVPRICCHRLPTDLNTNGRPRQLCLSRPDVPSQLECRFSGVDRSARERDGAQSPADASRAAQCDRAILVNVSTGPIAEAEDSMAELRELAHSAGVIVLDEMIQRRARSIRGHVLGKGKLDELLIRAMQLGADAIIFDRELQAAQVRSISEATDLKVIDRSQLILDIFAQRAQSHEGKIQVELAQLKYILPRLVMGQNSAFSRLAGGIGGRGPGETKLETDRRRVRDRITGWRRKLPRRQSVASNAAKSVCATGAHRFRSSAIPMPANRPC